MYHCMSCPDTSLNSTEKLSISVEVTNDIICDIEEAHTVNLTLSPEYEEELNSIKCERTLLQCERGRSQALEARLRNEMDLVMPPHNLV